MAKKLTPLHRKLEPIFSRYIRLRDTVDGYGNCISCGRHKHYDECDAGHFVKATYLIHKYEEKNVHLQCRYCNKFLDGNQAEYMRAMEAKYGREYVDYLLDTKSQVRKFKPWELEELIQVYTEKVAQLEIQ